MYALASLGLFFIIIMFIIFLAIIWSVIHCLISDLTGLQKLFWVLVLLILPLIGLMLYLIFINRNEKVEIMKDKLKRNEKEAVLAGVCAGIGDYFDVDPVLVRLLVVVLFFMSAGSVVIAYIIAWIIMPVGRKKSGKKK